MTENENRQKDLDNCNPHIAEKTKPQDLATKPPSSTGQNTGATER